MQASMNALRTLVVDDTIFYRKVLSDILKTFPEVEVVGTANNGKIALSRIKSLKPDLVTLDVEMPEMNGLEVLQEIKSQGLQTDCLVVSSLTETGGELTIKCLELGAFDFIPKPDQDSTEENIHALTGSLTQKLRAFKRRKEIRSLARHNKADAPEKRETALSAQDSRELLASSKTPEKRTDKAKAVAIGVSTGGPNALTVMLPKLPGALGVPVFVVQHMPPVFTASLAKALNAKCALEVKEAVNGEAVVADTVYVAPGGKQMKVASGAGWQKIIRISDDPPENNCKPSADYLFRSVAREYGAQSTGVVMTGMGSDGKLGIKLMKASGAMVIAQDSTTCVVYGMPKAIVDDGLADIIAPLGELAERILYSVR